MKTVNQGLARIAISTIAILICAVSFAQDVWNSNGNHADSNYFLGTINAEPLRIKTDSTDRIIVGVNDTIVFKGTSMFGSVSVPNSFIDADSINARVIRADEFRGAAVFDSIKIPNGFIQVDSIRARVIHVGDSSLVLGNACPSCGPFNLISTTVSGAQTLSIGPFNGQTIFFNNGGGTSDDARVGIGAVIPQNMLHLNRYSSIIGAYTQYTNNTTDLTSADGFLTGIAADGSAELKQQENFPMNFFTNGTPRLVIEANGNVGVNTSYASAKLNVNSTTTIYGAHVLCEGVRTINVGLQAGASNGSKNNVGIIGQGSYPQPFPTIFNLLSPYTLNAGVIGWAGGKRINFGGVFESNSPDCTETDIGIYASAARKCGPDGNLAGLFNGNVFATGTITGGGSDSKLKDSIMNLNGALAVISRLQPKHFVYKTDSFPYLNLPVGQQMGLIAQQVDTVLPELISEIFHPAVIDTDGTILMDTLHFKVLNYSGLIPLTIAGIIEQQYIIDSLSQSKVSSKHTPTDSNYVVKWSGTNNVLANSLIYDNGTKVGIGTPPTPSSKFYVHNRSEAIGAIISTTAGSEADSNRRNVGIIGFSAESPIQNIGVLGLVENEESDTSFMNIGTMGYTAGNTAYNVAGAFMSNDTLTNGVNIGVYASARHNAVNASTGVAGFFNGNLIKTGNDNLVSDSVLCDSITDISSAISTLSRLHPKHFVYKPSAYDHINLPVGMQQGLIAQQVDTVLPELVGSFSFPEKIDTSASPDLFHIATLNYTGLIPLMIAGIKEQQALIDSLNNMSTKVCSLTGATPPNNLAKWDSVNKELCSSIIYDDGQRIGIPSTDVNAYLSVSNSTDSVVAKFNSDNTGAAQVINATYNPVGSPDGTVDAVRGYSEYINSDGKSDGIGGHFEGGLNGVYGFAVGNGTREASVGVLGESKSAEGINIGVGGLSTYSDTGDVTNIGVFGNAESSNVDNVGVVGQSLGATDAANNAGFYGKAAGSTNYNIGGKFEAVDTFGVNYGVFGYADGSAPNFYAGYFDGDVNVTGYVTSASDARLKNNVTPVSSDDALAKILRLEPKTYEFRTADYPYLSLSKGTQYGLIAQDVEHVLPQLVSDIIQPERKDLRGNTLSPRLDYKGLNYTGIIPLLISAVKKQQVKIDSLTNVIDTRLATLEERVNSCCARGDNPPGGDGKTDETTNRITVELSSLQVVVLDQNAPNPFAEQTSISYFVPENFGSAQMMFTDITGTVIKSVDIQKGYGVVTVFAPNLSSGLYTYSLYVDGKLADTKKMTKTK